MYPNPFKLMVFLFGRKKRIVFTPWNKHKFVISWAAVLMVVLKFSATAYSASSKSCSEGFKNGVQRCFLVDFLLEMCEFDILDTHFTLIQYKLNHMSFACIVNKIKYNS